MIEHKHIKKIDIALIVGTVLIFLGFLFLIKPELNSPVSGINVIGPVLFSFKNGNVILIDDNQEFSSPQEIFVKDNLVIKLKPGTYYWRVKGAVEESETRNLTINSVVDLKLRQKGEDYEVVNSGNTLLDVDIYNKGIFTGSVTLDTDDSKNVSGTEFVGRQNESG